ncbi:MAG: phosphotriesterase-related protein [Acidimicrobiia bacterium]|nr:phosphotriesterase-related protein [Acidimicrobiia bacterium]
MATIETARGAIDSEALGRTLMHEHVFIVHAEVEQNYDTGFDEDAEVANAIARMDELKAAGIDTIVDLTVLGLGRHIPRLLRVASQTELNIVFATGVYTFDEVPFHHRFNDPDSMAELFVQDLTEGVRHTDARAGILKCATDEKGVTPGVEKVLRGVARAQVQTGAPISTHTHAGTRRGLEQQRIFAEEGVDLGRVVIGHSGDTIEFDYLEALVAAGSYLGMDRFGLNWPINFERRVHAVAEMCARGYAERLVLSHDTSCYIDQMAPGLVEKLQKRGWNYTHISKDVIPALQAAGVTDAQLHQMLVDNPLKILTNQPVAAPGA